MEEEGIATIEEELDQTEAFDSGSSPETSQIDEVIVGLEDQLETENSTNKTQEPESSGTSEAESLLSKFSGPEWVKPPTGPDNFSTFKLNEKNEWIEVKGVEEINHTQRIKESGDQQRLEEHLGRIEQLLANKALVEIRTSGLDIQTDLVDGVKVNTTEGSVYASLTILNPNGTITFEDREYKPQEKEEIFTEGQEAPEIVSDDYDEDYSPSFIGSLGALKAQLDLETIPAEANIGTLDLEASVGEILSDTSGIEIAEVFDDYDENTQADIIPQIKTQTLKIEMASLSEDSGNPEFLPQNAGLFEIFTKPEKVSDLSETNIGGAETQTETGKISSDIELAPDFGLSLLNLKETLIQFQTEANSNNNQETSPEISANASFDFQPISTIESRSPQELAVVETDEFEVNEQKNLVQKKETVLTIPETSATYAVAETWESTSGIEILGTSTPDIFALNPETFKQELPETLTQQVETFENVGITLNEVEEAKPVQNLEPFNTVQKFENIFALTQPQTEIQVIGQSSVEDLKPEVQTIEISGIKIEEVVETQKFSETDETQIIQQAVILEQSTNITILREVVKPQEAISIVDSGEEKFDIALSKMVETSNTSTEVREQITEASAQQEQASGITLEKHEETVIQKASTKPVRTTSIRTTPTQTRRTQTQSSVRRINSQPAFRTPITPIRTIIEPAQRPQAPQREVEKSAIVQKTPIRTTVVPIQGTFTAQQFANSSKPNIQPTTQRTSTSTTVIDSSIRPALRTNTISSVNELNTKVLNFKPTITTNEEVVTNEETSPFELELVA